MEYKLPPLPTPDVCVRNDFTGEDVYSHSAEQMRDYAIAAIEAQGVPDALREEAMNLASILSGMVEGGYSDLETLYTEDQADGDAFVKRAAEVLDLLASAPPAPQAEIVESTQPHPTNKYLFKLLCEKAGIVLGVDRVDTACKKVARMSPCVDSKCPNYWDDAYDDLKPSDIETDCEPAPQEVVEHQAQAPRAEKTHVLVPLRMTKAMREVVDVEDWSWAELLAAAEAVTEDEHAIAEQASVVQQEPVADIKISGDDFDLGLTDAFAFGRLRLPDGHYLLYTHPAPQAKPQPLLSSEIWNSDAIMEVNADAQLPYELIERFVRAVEAVHGITKE